MAENDDELIAELRSKHGVIEKFEVDGKLIVVRKPAQGDMLRFTNTIQAGNLGQAQIDMAISSVAHPPIKEFKEILSQWPGIAPELSAAATELSRGGLKSLGKD